MRKHPVDVAIRPPRGQKRLAHLPAVPADMRVGNLLHVLGELRQEEALSRSDLARSTRLGIPTVHRLIADLLSLNLIAERPARQDGAQKGRPAVTYELRNRGVLIAGVDAGNETTRWAVASAAGRILASSSKPTESIRRRLVDGIVQEIEALVNGLDVDLDNLAGVGIGIAAAVDPISGQLRDPPLHGNWWGLNLRELVEKRLGCNVTVRQDDHFAAIAEASSVGTFPDAHSLVVLEIGTGIGAAMMVNGMTMMGAHGRFGRIAGWPISTPRRGVAYSTLGASLVAGGLVDDYRRRDGAGQVTDGFSLFEAAASGDAVADAVLAWAGREIAELVVRLYRLCDPVGVVLGGGLARGFATLEPHLRPHLPPEIVLAPSVLGENTVVIGAILSSLPDVEAWVRRRLSQVESDSRRPRMFPRFSEVIS